MTDKRRRRLQIGGSGVTRGGVIANQMMIGIGTRQEMAV